MHKKWWCGDWPSIRDCFYCNRGEEDTGVFVDLVARIFENFEHLNCFFLVNCKEKTSLYSHRERSVWCCKKMLFWSFKKFVSIEKHMEG